MFTHDFIYEFMAQVIYRLGRDKCGVFCGDIAVYGGTDLNIDRFYLEESKAYGADNFVDDVDARIRTFRPASLTTVRLVLTARLWVGFCAKPDPRKPELEVSPTMSREGFSITSRSRHIDDTLREVSELFQLPLVNDSAQLRQMVSGETSLAKADV
jgi:hypothetical protein